MKFTYLLITCACVAAALVAATHGPTQVNAQQKQQPAAGKVPVEVEEKTELAKFMRQKLSSSNKILEGLVMVDMTYVEKGADELLKMSDAANWRASNDMMYLHHSRVFRSSVEAMRDKAKKGSIDGVALAWMDVTMSCIKCHEWVRDTMLADISLDGPATLSPHRAVASGQTGGIK